MFGLKDRLLSSDQSLFHSPVLRFVYFVLDPDRKRLVYAAKDALFLETP